MYNYILRDEDYKLHISENDKIINLDKSIQSFINSLLKKELTDLKSRVKVTKNVFNLKSKVPIYINPNLLLICIRSFRSENCFYINYHSIQSYEINNENILINFIGYHSMKIKEKYTFLMQIKKCQKILDYLN